MRRRPVLVAMIAVVLGTACVILSLPSIVGGLAEDRAAQRGLELTIDDVTVRPTRIWLRGVKLSKPGFEGANANFDFIEVRVGFGGVREVIVHGGRVELTGSREMWWERLRARRAETPSDTPVASEPFPISVEGVHVQWLVGATEQHNAWGVRVSQSGEMVHVFADLVRMQHPRGSVEAKGVDTTIARPGLALRSASAAETKIALLFGTATESPEADADADPETTDTTPDEKPAPDATAPPVDAEGAVPLDPERGPRLREAIRKLVGVIARRLPEQSAIDLDGVHLALHYGEEVLNLGPARLHGARGPESITLGFSPGAGAARPGTQLVDFAITAPIDEGPVAIRIAGGPIAPSRLGVRDGDLGLREVDGARLELELEGELSADGRVAKVATSGEIQRLTWAHPKVAPEPLRDIALSWNGAGEVNLDGSSFELSEGELRLGEVSAKAALSLKREAQTFSLSANLEVPLASCQDMFDSLPTAIVPLLRGMKLAGTFSWKAGVVVDSERLGKAKTQWKMQNDCRILEVPSSASTDRFKQPFSRTVPGTDGEPLLVWTGPGTLEWTPYGQVSRYLEVAVLTTEDGGFWAHRGFDQKAIEGSIKQNIKAGRFVRGASTISMQVAKNLYLSREKHLSRKVQEALLTMLLEQELRKDEILELYFNIIEFGPDVWGIRMASDYYFNSKPHELSLAQCFFLASILPNPTAQYFQQNGQLKPFRRDYVRRLMNIAHGRQRLSAAELAMGLEQEVLFGVPHLLSEEALDELEERSQAGEGMPVLPLDSPGP